nr:hypothetical transcript [Hymenolepis microstoma]
MQNLGVSFVADEYDWLSSCLAIALILDCPIAATSSDLFVCSKPNSIPEVFKSLIVNELKFGSTRTSIDRTLTLEEGRFEKRANLAPSDFFKLSAKLVKGTGHEDMPLTSFTFGL